MIAVVTGGGSGIGRAISIRLASAGWSCLLAGLENRALEQTASLVQAADVRTHECDISTQDGRRSLTKAAESMIEREKLGLLVNCAGQTSRMALFDQRETAWCSDLETNLIAIGFLSGWAIETMKESNGGAIVNVGSVYGSIGRDRKYYEGLYSSDGVKGPTTALAYHASKGGLLPLTRELAVMAGRWNIRVNTVSPGMVRIPERKISPGRVKKFANATPIGRMGTPDDIAAIVEFLASDGASFVTGAEWIADGGWSIW